MKVHATSFAAYSVKNRLLRDVALAITYTAFEIELKILLKMYNIYNVY